ncbi:antirestriction protein ArdA [Christensenellaceae bacterium OttesenSCG-928-L17]|nr:antirestriction protein ArdA [Christensenellaceae bacterium OttesenSCG-928-L17]
MSRQIDARIVNTDDMEKMPGDLNRLKSGDFKFKWHRFPATQEEMQQTLKQIGMDDTKQTDYMADSFDTVIYELNDVLPRFVNLDELNYLAVKMDGMTEQQQDIFRAVIESGRHCGSMKDIINIVENLDSFDLQPAFSPQMYGEFLAEMYRDHFAGEMEALEKSEDPAMRELAAHIGMLDNHLDATSYGLAVAAQDNGVFTEQGLLTESGDFHEVYRGPQDIPAEYRVSPPPERELAARPSVMDKLAAAKEAAEKQGAERPDKPSKSHDAEL